MIENVYDNSTSSTALTVLKNVEITDDYVFFKSADNEYCLAQGDVYLSSSTENMLKCNWAEISRFSRVSYVDDDGVTRYTYNIDVFYDTVNVDVTKGICYNNIIDGYPQLEGVDEIARFDSILFAICVFFIFIVVWGIFGSISRRGTKL